MASSFHRKHPRIVQLTTGPSFIPVKKDQMKVAPTSESICNSWFLWLLLLARLMSCKCANWFLVVLICWHDKDSNLSWWQLSLFHIMLVGWWPHFRRFLSTETLCQRMVKLTAWCSSSCSLNQKSFSLSSQLSRLHPYLWLGLGLLAAKLNLATPCETCLLAQGHTCDWWHFHCSHWFGH